MEISGIDHVFYSDISVFDVSKIFIEKLKHIWKNPIIEEFDRVDEKYIELFFAKDKVMYDRHDEEGYNSDVNGESCFMLLGSKHSFTDSDFFFKKSIFPANNTIPHEGRFIFKEYWSITLVIAEAQSKNDFQNLILKELINTIYELGSPSASASVK